MNEIPRVCGMCGFCDFHRDGDNAGDTYCSKTGKDVDVDSAPPADCELRKNAAPSEKFDRQMKALATVSAFLLFGFYSQAERSEAKRNEWQKRAERAEAALERVRGVIANYYGRCALAVQAALDETEKTDAD